ncbi:endo-1,3-beta-glucanase Engl1 [Dissophora ornata]|nr:endo-1,3-beta-glucanase Engl1 [Dissophora ornata]
MRSFSQSSQDSILQPISTDPPLSIFQQRAHVVQPMRIRPRDRTKPLATNKFYGNLMNGDSHAPIWTHPYGLRWDSNSPSAQGLGISHIDDNMKAFGPSDSGSSKYYINPFLVSMGLSATEFDAQHQMTVGDFGEFGCTMELSPVSEAGNADSPRAYIRVPIVRGMAFITGMYKGLTPKIFSNILVRTLTRDPRPMSGGWVKYRFLIEDGITWLLYAKSDQGATLALVMRDQAHTEATSGKFTGVIQIAKLPVGNEAQAESIYDAAVGVYATSGQLVVQKRYVSSNVGAYEIKWKLAGNTKQQFIHFTLPHHRDVLTDICKPTTIVLPSTTKGKMVAYVGSSWHLYEPERLSAGFLPDGWEGIVTEDKKNMIRKQAELDADMDFDQQTNLDSMYFAGKGLAKFALLSLVVTDVLKDNGALKAKCIDKLKSSFERFMENRQMFPLVYDTTWKGLVSVQGLDNGALSDFGNTWYNDHHYHYGYFVHTAAIIRHLDPTWRADDISSFVNSLIRDVANPSSNDPHFPVFRSFDWFMGHSWSQGIFISLDGKDEESTSEDINLYYAMSLWGRVNNNPGMDQLGQLMLTIARRSIQSYFLLESDNTNQPKAFIGNKVTGILFENKVDHATYFSPRIECIQGIQMIPATPALPLVRRREFVQQEWTSLLESRVGEIQDGWKSILMMNYAMLDKEGAWQYFAADNGSPVPLDDGMTKTWALFYVASMQS